LGLTKIRLFSYEPTHANDIEAHAGILEASSPAGFFLACIFIHG